MITKDAILVKIAGAASFLDDDLYEWLETAITQFDNDNDIEHLYSRINEIYCYQDIRNLRG